MKKLLAVLLVIAAYSLSIAADASALIGSGLFWGKPSNVVVYTLGTNGSTADSIAATNSNVYGPYNLSVDPSRPAFKGFRVYFPTGSLASGDSVAFKYQLIAGDKITDTIASWTVVDTFINSKRSSYVDISSLAGTGIVFKVTNIDASKVGVLKKPKVVCLAPSTESIDIKK